MAHVTYHGGSQEIQALIDGVVADLPQSEQTFVMNRICFISVGRGHGHGQTWNKRFLRPALSYGDDDVADWLVVLNEDGLLPADDQSRRTIAHEIAHAWLGHGETTNPDEDAADRQAQQWGFEPRSA